MLKEQWAKELLMQIERMGWRGERERCKMYFKRENSTYGLLGDVLETCCVYEDNHLFRW